MTWTPVNLEDYPADNVNVRPNGWNMTAFECYQSNRNCKSCLSSQATDFRLCFSSRGENRCHMPGVVQHLLKLGPAPASLENPSKSGRNMEHLKGIPLVEKRQRLYDLRAKICEFLSKGAPLTLYQLCERLNAAALNDYQNWHAENIRGSVYKMMASGAVQELRDHFPIKYELIDASKLADITSWQGVGKKNKA